MSLERLQKIIAAAGIASRRKAEELITGGLVSVNGQVVTELGTKADLATDRIKVAGKALAGPERHVYLLLHKPKGYVTTVTDPEHRPTVIDLVRGVGARLYPVGRLDYLSEGLLLLTNDGELAQKLTHASSHVPKTYLVKVSGKPTEDELAKLRGGVFLPAETKPLKTREGNEQRRRSQAVRTGPVRIELLRDAANPWYEITLIEGRNRQIRRMFEQVGHHVEKIKRVRYGPLQLDVEVGQFRHLTSSEVAQLKTPTKVSKPGRKPERSAPLLTAGGGSDKKVSRPASKQDTGARRDFRKKDGLRKTGKVTTAHPAKRRRNGAPGASSQG
jgi:23S rRNA pseudouridine2605 synthase